LEVFQYEKGEYVISQGDENAEQFYIIQNGSVEITLNIPNWNELEQQEHIKNEKEKEKTQRKLHENGTISKKEREKYVKTLREGCYFGERALLFNTNRSANVIVSSQVLRCVAMDKASFLRLVEKPGVYDKIRRNIAQYSFSEKLLNSQSRLDTSQDGDDNSDNDN